MEEIKIKTDDGYEIKIDRTNHQHYVYIIHDNRVQKIQRNYLLLHLPCPVYFIEQNAEKELERLNAPKITVGSYVLYVENLYVVISRYSEDTDTYIFKNVITEFEYQKKFSTNMKLLNKEEVKQYLEDLGWKYGIRFTHNKVGFDGSAVFTLEDFQMTDNGIMLYTSPNSIAPLEQCQIYVQPKKGDYISFYGIVYYINDDMTASNAYPSIDILTNEKLIVNNFTGVYKLTNEEVIKYLEDSGWNKGVKFDYQGNMYYLDGINVLDTGILLKTYSGYLCHFNECKIHEITQAEAFAELVSIANKANEGKTKNTQYYTIDSWYDSNGGIKVVCYSNFIAPIVFFNEEDAKSCLNENLHLWKAYFNIK